MRLATRWQVSIARRRGTGNNRFTGLGQADLSLPGMVSVKGFIPMQAGAGDYFEVWLLASAALSAQPFPSQFGLGSLATDPHPAHSYFAGVMSDDSDLAALTAQVAAAQASITDLQTRLAALGG
jgi:hypothetical protein